MSSGQTAASAAPAPSQSTQGVPPGSIDLGSLSLQNLDRTQIMTLLSHIPGVFSKPGADKEDAAKVLSNLATNPSFNPNMAIPPPPPGGFPPGVGDPGPSSHPRGPPNLGQLSAVAMQAAPNPPPPQPQDHEDRHDEGSNEAASPPMPSGTGGGRRSRGGAAMGSDEWTRQRKDNHKEVERRRRGNINEGINELGRIVPNGSGEKAKGAILSRAVQYIHHLKENEARNIEKWTLEKLLMDQAMGDLQAQLEEVRRMWDEERQARQRAEADLQMLRSGGGPAATAGQKRSSEDSDGKNEDTKRQRTE